MYWKKMVLIFSVIFLSSFIGYTGFAQEVIIENEDPLTLEEGESVQLEVVFLDAEGEEVDTTFDWSAHPGYLGNVDSNSVFFAGSEGEGILIAAVGDYSDTLNVVVEEAETEEPEESPIYVTPGDTVLAIGSQVQFQAWERDTLGNSVEVDASWSFVGDPIGTLSETGLLDVTTAGFSFIQATAENGSATALVIAEEEADTTGTNSITITRTTPNPRGYSVMAEITEGEAWTIGGLPRPMNVLNGGMIYFPHGSLHEDIRLHVDLPGFAEHHGDSVGYGGDVVTGVQFRVIVNDTIVEPYYFDDPLFVGLIFKRGLLRQMGIEPQDLALYFAMEEGDTLAFDTTGISNTVVDSCRNMIFSNVVHFSDLVVAPREGSQGIDGLEAGISLPVQFYLEQNYPNPFNAATNISYNLTQTANVRLYVYDILGREVTRLVDGRRMAGYHTISFNGQHLASGLYYIRLGNENSWIQARKMTLIK